MTCRAPSGSVTCAGTPTGALMTYDNERRLATWQNTPSNPTATASYWYDGEGQRVAQTLNGTTTYYVGNDEEITGSTLLKYYHIPGLPVLGTITGVTRTYLASDGLGSETVDLSYNGTVLAQALYGPYGVGRYATGTMPTSRGYTGQRQDSGSGLDYYGARYYDASVGQFTSADSVQGPNRYAYVGGNPETATDPTGKRFCVSIDIVCVDRAHPVQSLANNVSILTSAFAGGVAAYYTNALEWGTSHPLDISIVKRVWFLDHLLPGGQPRVIDVPSGTITVANPIVDDATTALRVSGVVGWGLLGLSVAADAYLSTRSYSQSHPHSPQGKAILYGLVHSGISNGIAYGFAAAGSEFGPGGAILGGLVGSIVGPGIADAASGPLTDFLTNTGSGALQFVQTAINVSTYGPHGQPSANQTQNDATISIGPLSLSLPSFDGWGSFSLF